MIASSDFETPIRTRSMARTRIARLPRILVAEEDPELGALMDYAFGRAGYEVFRVVRSSDFLELLDQFDDWGKLVRIDLVILLQPRL